MSTKAAVLASGTLFLVGIGVGLALREGPSEPAGAERTSSQQARGDVDRAAKLAARPGIVPPARSGEAKTGRPAGEPGPAGPGGSPAGTRIGSPGAPPPPPPPPSARALEEGDKIKRELDRRKGKRGGGRVTTLVYPKDPKQAAALEERRLKRWETRLRYGNEIRIKGLRKKVGLSANQETRLRKILDDELAQRQKLVRQHMAKKLSNSSFDAAVKQNRNTARQAVKELLTADQFKAYGQLKPREQVLRDDVK